MLHVVMMIEAITVIGAIGYDGGGSGSSLQRGHRGRTAVIVVRDVLVRRGLVVYERRQRRRRAAGRMTDDARHQLFRAGRPVGRRRRRRQVLDSETSVHWRRGQRRSGHRRTFLFH